jgi:hypothetical protein
VDAPFLIAVAVSLCFLTGLIVARMAACGASPRRMIAPVVELWLAFALWIATFRFLAAAAGPPAESGFAGMGDLAARLGALAGPARWLGIAGVIVSAGLCAHLIWSLRRALTADARG